MNSNQDHLIFFYFNLQMEGIFRINPENSREEYVREQLNNGVIPDDIDVHCLAGLIKVLLHCSGCMLNSAVSFLFIRSWKMLYNQICSMFEMI